MQSIAQVARIWNAAGVSTIPILPNGTKRPAVQWGEYQAHLPQLGEIDYWWANGHEYGLALIMGKVSGNLEMLELEGRVCDTESLLRIEAAAERLGCLHLWEKLVSSVYTEESPSGGLHFIYRIVDHEVPGNEKVAERPTTAAEKVAKPGERTKVLAETRGEGGYVIVAPTSGLCHPSGTAWTKVRGEYGDIVNMLWSTRQLIHQAIREALHEDPPETPAIAVSSPGAVAGTHLWDEFDRTAHFPSLLRERGWQSGRGEREWTRPGKDPRDGHSATLDHDGTNRLFVFSTSSGLDTDRYFTPFEFLAYWDYSGDIKLALRELHIIQPIPSIDTFEFTAEPVAQRTYYTLTDMGNAQRLSERSAVRGNFHYVWETKEYWTFNGEKWVPDRRGSLMREVASMAEDMIRQGDSEDNKALGKWGHSSLSNAKVQACLSLFKSVKGVTRETGEFDQNFNLLNLKNGTLDLRTGILQPHNSNDLITRVFKANYNPQATCPNWDRFMEQAIPDPEIRQYVQRAAGYSLMGTSDQRSMFILHGPSGTGKSTFLETIEAIFADYGVTAAAGTFKSKGKEGGPSNDLHDLRGKRFVSSSETAQQATFDEELLKRITGRDTIKSRELYQSNQEWIPECVLWMATNHKPRFTSDDNAIWKRLKLVPFVTEFLGDGEIPNMARNVLIPEADGILNWLLQGLRDFREHGLQEPEEIATAAEQLRQTSDSVASFITDQVEDGILVLDETKSIELRLLMNQYETWCTRNREQPVKRRRFLNKVESMFPQLKVSGNMLLGITSTGSAGILGTFLT